MQQCKALKAIRIYKAKKKITIIYNCLEKNNKMLRCRNATFNRTRNSLIK